MLVVALPAGQESHLELNLETLGIAHPIYYEAKQLKVLKTTGENGINATVIQFEDDKKGNAHT